MVHPSVKMTRKQTVHTLSSILMSFQIRKEGRKEEKKRQEEGARRRIEAWRDVRFERGGEREVEVVGERGGVLWKEGKERKRWINVILRGRR